ncbi:MAG: alginate export family protein, partial [Caulobacteraceae bacterium]
MAAALAFALPQVSHAAEPWTLQSALSLPDGLKLSGLFRVRYEGLTGQARVGLGANTDVYTTRGTLEAEYDAGPVRFDVEVEDSRAFGATPRTGITSNDVNVFELLQAYILADVKTPIGPGLVQAGRFIIPSLGSRRLISGGDDRNASTGFTGVKLDTKAANGTAVTLLFTAPQIRLPDDLPSVLDNKWGFDHESLDLVLWGGFVARPKLFGAAGVDFGFVGLDERDKPGRPTRNRRLRTATARVIRPTQPGQFNYEAEAGYQFGSIARTLAANAPRQDVSAYFLHLEAGYQFDGPAHARVSALYDLASGDEGKDRYGRFDSLYGMRRRDYASGGLFAAVGRTNISSPGLTLDATPTLRIEAYFSYRTLWLASTTDSFSTTGVRDPAGASGSYAGQLVEARMRYWVIPHSLRFEIDGLTLIKGRFLKTAP